MIKYSLLEKNVMGGVLSSPDTFIKGFKEKEIIRRDVKILLDKIAKINTRLNDDSVDDIPDYSEWKILKEERESLFEQVWNDYCDYYKQDRAEKEDKPRKKPGNKETTIEEVISSEDKQSVIDIMREKIQDCLHADDEIKYLHELVDKKILSRIPPYKTLKDHGLTKVSSGVWYGARKKNEPIKPFEKFK